MHIITRKKTEQFERHDHSWGNILIFISDRSQLHFQDQ